MFCSIIVHNSRFISKNKHHISLHTWELTKTHHHSIVCKNKWWKKIISWYVLKVMSRVINIYRSNHAYVRPKRSSCSSSIYSISTKFQRKDNTTETWAAILITLIEKKLFFNHPASMHYISLLKVAHRGRLLFIRYLYISTDLWIMNNLSLLWGKSNFFHFIFSFQFYTLCMAYGRWLKRLPSKKDITSSNLIYWFGIYWWSFVRLYW